MPDSRSPCRFRRARRWLNQSIRKPSPRQSQKTITEKAAGGEIVRVLEGR